MIDKDGLSNIRSVHQATEAPGPESNSHLPKFGHAQQSELPQRMGDTPHQYSDS